MMIAEDNGANSKVVELFAFFHDSMRENDNRDPMHGCRAAELVESLTLDFLGINQEEKSLLMTACRHHTDRLSETDNITVLTCWDSDALDLGRIGVMPLQNVYILIWLSRKALFNTAMNKVPRMSENYK